jgi:glutaminyl-peptide cyclotransferase
MTRTKLLAVALLSVLLTAGCHSNSPASTQAAAQAVPQTVPFDDAWAYKSLVAQCAFGPRVPGTKPHQLCAAYIVDQLRPYVDRIQTQSFTWHDPHKNIDVPMANIYGLINPSAPHRIMLCAHWDTRPTADQDFDPANRSKPIPGADDGASGVAVLLELARAFHTTHPKDGVILTFWDGEDWGPGDDCMYIGARHFAHDPADLRPDESVLIDMIGQTNLFIPEEQTSEQTYPKLVARVWNTAAALGYGANFPQRVDYSITDDHIPLIEAGIPSIDLIDFNYAYWHTLADTPDKCSPVSLGIVGRVLGSFVLAGG